MGLDCAAGGYLQIALEAGAVGRPFSLCRPPEGRTVAFCVKHGEGPINVRESRGGGDRGSKLASRLACLQPGAELFCSGSFVQFDLDRVAAADWLFVATGTGIAPFHALSAAIADRCRSGRWRQAVILVGAHATEELLFNQGWCRLAAELPAIAYLPVLSTGGTSVSRRGRVQEHLGEALAKIAVPEAQALLCGHPEMVEQLRGRLLAAGLAEGAIAL